MSDYKESFYASLAAYVRSMGYDVKEVFDFKEETEEGGYCDTCWYSQTVVRVWFKDSDGDDDYYTYYGSMAEFVRGLCAA